MGEQNAFASSEHPRKGHPAKQTEATVTPDFSDGLPPPPKFPLAGPLPPEMQLPTHYPSIQQIIIGPAANEHGPIDTAITRGDKSVNGEWFRVSTTADNDALVAAKKAGSNVNIIEDLKNMQSPFSKQQLQILTNGKVPWEYSSAGFNISHSKAATIDSTKDGQRTIIGSMNLTNENARDIEFITNDSGIYKSVNDVINADVINAKNGTTNTPTGLDPALVVSPVNAEDKLSGLIYSVDPDPKKGWVVCDSENWGDPVIQQALLDVAAHGIPVKVLGPEEDENPNPSFNYPYLKAMQTGGVQAKWMPNPAPGENPDSPTHPYEHLKTIVVMTPDGPVGYLGSVNFSFQSAHQIAGLNKANVDTSKVKPNREMGLLFNDPAAINAVMNVFNTDFANAADLPATAPPTKTAPATTETREDAEAIKKANKH